MAMCVSHENPVLRDKMLHWNPAQPEVKTLIDDNLLSKVDVLSLVCVCKRWEYDEALGQ